MSHAGKTKEQLLVEMGELRLRISELKKQEMEWRQNKEKPIESEENFRALAENANDGIMIALGDGVCVYANRRATEIMGYSDSELRQKTIKDLVHPDELEKVTKRYKTIIQGGLFPEQHETRIIRKDGRSVPLEVTSARTVWHGESADLVIFRDISERKQAEAALKKAHAELEQQVEQRTADLLQANRELHREVQERTRAEEALRQSEEHFRSIFEKSQDAICLIDDKGYFQMVNEAACDLVSVSRQDLMNKHYSAFIDKETYHLLELYWERRKLDEPAPSRYEFKVTRPDGDIRIVENVPTIVRFSDKSPLSLAILRDVTERRRMEDTLDSMRSKLLNLQENERSTISRVLHDTIGQNISILDFNLTTIAEMLDRESLERIKGLIENMRSVIRETGNKLRDISSDLHPRIVQELGLVAGINNLIERLRRTTGLKVETSIALDEFQIGESVASNLYRIVQETLTNVVKHAKCSAVSLEMVLADRNLAMVIKDNGQGFSLEDVNRREIEQRGMGIFIMTERAKAIGGKLQIISEPNQGTELQVEVPLMMA